jgi:hypothetical protein
MRFVRYGLVIGALLAASASFGLAQPPGDPFLEAIPRLPAAPAPVLAPVPTQAPVTVPAPIAVAAPVVPVAAPAPVPELPQQPAKEDIESHLSRIEQLRKEQAELKAATQTQEQKKRIELLQKQVETLEKMVRLMADQLKKQPPAGAEMERLETQVASLGARSLQAARRDRELAGAVDDLREHIDAEERYGPRLPSQLKELFLLSGTNESPLSIYGALSVGYSKIQGDTASAANGAGRPPTPGGFYFGEFTPDFLLKLNEWIFLEAEIAVGSDGSVSAGSFAQANFIVNDWLTIIAGRFVAPIGFYNLALNTPWINKLPADAPGSAPLVWLQVLPPFSMLGLQARGSFYLGCTPIKMEYAAYISNGLNLTPATAGSPTINELANLENMENTFNIITNEKAVGGRVGFWWPAVGLAAGFSAMYNGDYIAGGLENSIRLFAADASYHKGNWDLRAEYGMTYQEAQPFLSSDITRYGFYAQAAYRPRDCGIRCLEDLEFVYRYSYVNFKGIDRTMLDLTTFSTPIDVPVRRQQNEIGVNYYVTPRLVLKCAYQINDEPGFHLHDNQFLAELDWGW